MGCYAIFRAGRILKDKKIPFGPHHAVARANGSHAHGTNPVAVEGFNRRADLDDNPARLR